MTNLDGDAFSVRDKNDIGAREKKNNNHVSECSIALGICHGPGSQIANGGIPEQYPTTR
jgi:hypothetical protein